MKLLRAGAARPLAVAVLLAIPAVVSAQLTCNLQTPPCPGSGPCGFTCTPSLGGCPTSQGIQHNSTSPCAGGGSFDLCATQYATAAGRGLGRNPPPTRYWSYDNYNTPANMGCGWPGPDFGEWLLHPNVDLGAAYGPACHWILYQANWSGCAVAGCPPGGAGERTVVEITDVDLANEGRISHSSWYLIASVDRVGAYDFDRITGSTGCDPAAVPTSTVPAPVVVGRGTPPLTCTGSTAPTFGTVNAIDPGFGDILVALPATPEWYTEAGLRGAPTLISGFQVVYVNSATEPTTSDWASGVWQPTRNPGAPTTEIAGVGTGGTTVTVTVPRPTPPALTWLATRIVYTDTSINPTTPQPSGTITGPFVASQVSGHCGPVNFGGIIFAVNFDSVTATRIPGKVLVRWTTSYEDDVAGFQVFRTTSPSAESVEAVGAVERAHGAWEPYEREDLTADPSKTYYYYVQEKIMGGTGWGAKSELVEVVGLNDGGSTGGRTRERLVR